MLVPLFCLAFTAYRILNDVEIAINTYYRVDEILAGGILAWIFNEKLGSRVVTFLTRVNQIPLIVLLLISCHPESGFMNYLWPYFAAIVIYV